MSLQLEWIGPAHEAAKVHQADYDPNSGRIYLIEINGLVKVGKARNIRERVRQHIKSARAYGLTVGRVGYSAQMKIGICMERSFHMQALKFRVDGCREVYSASIETLIEAVDIKHEPADPIDPESKSAWKATLDKRKEAARLTQRECNARLAERRRKVSIAEKMTMIPVSDHINSLYAKNAKLKKQIKKLKGKTK